MWSLTQIKQFLGSRTGRLALTYLAIIMVMTIIFSVVIYGIIASQFNRPLPPRGAFLQDDFTRQQVVNLFQERAEQAKLTIFGWLALLNIGTLIGGAAFSYYLARKTLEPIETAMEAQSQFVSDASHELRTPLTALQTTNEVALRKKKLSIGEAKELISHNVTETVKLRELSDALLGLVKQENADTSTAPTNIQTVVGDVLQTIVANAQSKDITIEDTTKPIEVVTNQPAVHQVLKIFLDNAIKYSPNNSVVSIVSNETQQDVTIDVVDNGIGIASDQQERVFDRFYRVDQSRSKLVSDGNGLGLSIAKAISERQNFNIELESTIGSGSTFRIRIPK